MESPLSEDSVTSAESCRRPSRSHPHKVETIIRDFDGSLGGFLQRGFEKKIGALEERLNLGANQLFMDDLVSKPGFSLTSKAEIWSRFWNEGFLDVAILQRKDRLANDACIASLEAEVKEMHLKETELKAQLEMMLVALDEERFLWQEVEVEVSSLTEQLQEAKENISMEIELKSQPNDARQMIAKLLARDVEQ